MGSLDASLINLFSHPDMVKDLLRGFIREDWVGQLDFRTLAKVETTFISEHLEKRSDDVVWKVRWGTRWLYVYILIEFQARGDPWMGLRMLTYVALLYQDLIKQKAVSPPRKLPPVLPIVLYNGERPWSPALSMESLVEASPRGLERYVPRFDYLLIDEKRFSLSDVEENNLVGALVALEQSVTPEKIQAVVDRLVNFLKAPRQRSLRRAFAVWLNRVVLPARGPKEDPVNCEDLGEVQSMLQQRVKRWVKDWEAAGIEKGKAEAFKEFARRLLAAGDPIDRIVALTGLSLTEVEALKANPDSVAESAAPYGKRPRAKAKPARPFPP